MADQPRKTGNDPCEIERYNLVTIFKLVTSEVVKADGPDHEDRKDEEFVPMQQLLTILERIFLFALKDNEKGFFALLEQIEEFCPDAAEFSVKVREASHLKTQLGKARAWLRLAMMQKKLADYVSVLIDQKEMLREYYENGAILLAEDSAMLYNTIKELSCIDCHLSIGERADLDGPVDNIDYSLLQQRKASLPGPDIDSTASSVTPGQSCVNGEKIETMYDVIVEIAGYVTGTNNSSSRQIPVSEPPKSALPVQKLRDANQRIEIIETVMAKQKEEQVQLSQELENVDQRITKLQADVDKQDKGNMKLAAKCNQLANSNIQQMQELNACNQKVAELETELGRQKEAKTKLSQEQRDASHKILSLEEDMERKREDNTRLAEKCKQLETDKNLLAQELSNAKQDIHMLKFCWTQQQTEAASQTRVLQEMTNRQNVMERMLEELEIQLGRPICTDETGDQEVEDD